MVAYNFKARFVPAVLSGAKAQTIRGERKRHARTGEAVQLSTGSRYKPRRLGEAPCLSAQPIRIELPRARVVPEVLIFEPGGALFRRIVGPRELAQFARADGFKDFDDLHAFWAAEHPGLDTFHGVLIRWRPLVAADALDLAGAA